MQYTYTRGIFHIVMNINDVCALNTSMNINDVCALNTSMNINHVCALNTSMNINDVCALNTSICEKTMKKSSPFGDKCLFRKCPYTVIFHDLLTVIIISIS